jgi:ribonuclease BN (tRNA processing enzyme)
MRVTVLGKSPAWQDAGGACSGYLVEADGTAVLLDCGSGVFGKLREHLDYTDVDAVVVSHLHADHVLDLVPFASALVYAPRQQPVPVDRWPGTATPARPALHAPQGAKAAFRRICGGAGMPEDHIERAFVVEEYAPEAVLEAGPLRLRFAPVPHFLPTWAVEVASEEGCRLTYGADCAPTDGLVAFARETDLLVLEATLPRPERTGVRGHLTPAEAGDHARRAGARRLVLTHFSDELDPLWVRAEAERTFGGPVELAREGAAYDVRAPAGAVHGAG